MKKIILPTDFSINAENAIAYAIHLFKDEKCAFYLLNTFMPPAHYEEYPWHSDLEPSNLQKSMNQLNGLLRRLTEKTKNPGHLFIPHSAMNSVVGEIKELIKKEKIDLVIMGTKGNTGAKSIIFGSNTTEVIRKIECPVIAVPSGFEQKGPKNILFATDYEITYTKEQLNETLSIAGHHGSHIFVLHVSSTGELTQDQQNNKARLEEVIKDADYRTYFVTHENVRSAINEFRDKEGIDFLVMIQNKHTFMERLFLKSNIKEIGLQIVVPFMVIPCPS